MMTFQESTTDVIFSTSCCLALYIGCRGVLSVFPPRHVQIPANSCSDQIALETPWYSIQLFFPGVFFLGGGGGGGY